MADPGISRGITLLDGGSLVSGAAVAAVHFRQFAPNPQTLPGWLGASAVFGWLAVTATGPFLLIARRWLTGGSRAQPRLGDWLWLLWGAPWLGTVFVAGGRPVPTTAASRLDPVYVGSLSLGLMAATAVAVPLLIAWMAWGPVRWGTDDHRLAWSQAVGLLLTAAWPIQCAVGLLMMG